MEELIMREIDIEQDETLLLNFREDAQFVSYGKTHFDKRAYVNRLRARIEQWSSGQLFIQDSSQPIGQIGLTTPEYQGRTIGYANLFYLIPDYRGKGFGKQMVDFAEETFKKHKLAELHLKVSPSNESALDFYQLSGFNRISQSYGEFPKLRMRKFL
ncbi:GNAT family N-acetyltransferase [Halobacillus yeomjeoni]|uniref:GNAT family N-acetyltransferase n=1 Tax=Halobacillus yeomjeoni TaxID=311194 RepID=UPI001CD3C346|nr:GNAT family N-acetyltransferase [Halobacillus yeomjeoni]MCA0982867.1 GNAT family N-acetyltransferase [Halobacillus yeomjeoni]